MHTQGRLISACIFMHANHSLPCPHADNSLPCPHADQSLPCMQADHSLLCPLEDTGSLATHRVPWKDWSDCMDTWHIRQKVVGSAQFFKNFKYILIICLTGVSFCVLWVKVFVYSEADSILKYSYIFQKIGFHILCKLSLKRHFAWNIKPCFLKKKKKKK